MLNQLEIARHIQVFTSFDGDLQARFYRFKNELILSAKIFNVNVLGFELITSHFLFLRLHRPQQNYGQSSALANANAYNQYQGPGGFGGSNALAGAQSFQSQGPLGGFGASAANSGTQSQHAGPGGMGGSAGMSGSQSYNLPNGHQINLAYGQGFSHENGQASVGQSNSLTYTK